MNLGLIRTFAEERKITFRKIASLAGMSDGNLHRCIRTNRIQADVLEKIAKFLNVSICVFFDEFTPATQPLINGSNNQYNESGATNNTNTVGDSVLFEKVRILETLNNEREERIKELKERIEELKSMTKQ